MHAAKEMNAVDDILAGREATVRLCPFSSLTLICTTLSVPAVASMLEVSKRSGVANTE